MRPVERGEEPQIFQKYQDAKPFLVERLGDYCSYCERRIPTLLAVEHVLPKSLYPDLQETWSNFLLGCVNCNSTKSNQDLQRNNILLPDQDNTALAYEYNAEGQVFPQESLSTDVTRKANALLRLTGLDKFPDEFDTDELYVAALERWQQRIKAWQVAIESRNDLDQNDSAEMRRTIIRLAIATGFFSIWMTVFSEDQQMRLDLIQAFPGTAQDCFDLTGIAINRPDGQL